MSALDKGLEKVLDRVEGAKLEVLARYQAGLQETVNALRVTGARALPLYGSGSQLVSNSRGRVTGYALRETSGANPAVVRLRAGRDSGGDLLVPIALTAGQSRTEAVPAVSYGDGLFVEVVSGTVEGAVFVGAVD